LISGITQVILLVMKTAISVPNDVFELSEKLAKKLKVSRSKIFAMGIKKLAEEHDDDEVTARLNEFYGKEKAEIDPVIMKMAALSLPKEEW
jgi:hypothetical protein